ncbi:GFA family protein [Caulobacter sp. KR2-114]|uniref:GFA family protein n=1 Tax=Caulobacter sp. KR2-114 TaxID=3400912 RepID=UPI003C080453
MATINGGCLCGAVSYTVEGEPIFVGHCACQNCQRSTGASHSTVAAYPEPQVTIRGTTTSYQGVGDSGQPTTHEFCPTCGSRLFTRASVMPNVVMIAVGTMEPDAPLEPSMLIYGKRRRAWDHVPEGVAVFEGMPAPPQ